MKKSSLLIGALSAAVLAVTAALGYFVYDVSRLSRENTDLLLRNEKIVEEREGLLDQIRISSEKPRSEANGTEEHLKKQNELLQREKENLLARISQLSEVGSSEPGSDVNELRRENASMREDRENLLAQIRILISERNRMNDVLKEMEETQQLISAAERDKAILERENAELKDAISGLEARVAEITDERDGAMEAYDAVTSKGAIRDLKNEISQNKKEKRALELEMKKLELRLERSEKEKKKIEELKNKLDYEVTSYKAKYDQAVRTNRELEGEMRKLPKKFAEMAKENTKLVRETAKTHYNLGVFYTKNKEYKRAVAEFEKALEIAPDEAYTHFNLGYLYAEHVVERQKALWHFKAFLNLTKGEDPDIDWVRKYVLTWEAYEGKTPIR